ncbi:MAG TPA: cation-transporting P-type ATPase, partial [Candidatus Paceibacterota bacterium]
MEAINILPGRIRFKSNTIYNNKPLARYINTYTDGIFGVTYCNVNIYTCSILIKYDSKKISFNTIKDNLHAVINTTPLDIEEKLNHYNIYYKTLEKKNISRNKFLAFSLIYIFFKSKQISFGKFSLSKNVLVFELASAVTIIGGYPLLRKFFKQSTRSISRDSEIILNLIAISFTISRESSKGVLVLVLKHMNNYIKLASDAACMKTLNCNMSRTSGMAWLIRDDQQEILQNVNNLKIDDIIVVHKGELIPADGEIIEGKASVNSLYLTGQPIINEVTIGNKVYETIVLIEGELKIKVSNVPQEYHKTDLLLKDLNITAKLNVYENIITPISIGLATVNFLFNGNILNALGILLVFTPSASRTALNSGIRNYVTALRKQNIYLRNPECIESI